MLAGDQARDFAVEMGLEQADLTTPFSKQIWEDWHQKQCQPNYRENVAPDPRTHCGPYSPVPPEAGRVARRLGPSHQRSSAARGIGSTERGGQRSHDTIAMVAINAAGSLAAGTSTNGANHKVPGRVGDSPIPGAGVYGDSEVGGCGATGDGDQMMRLLPTYFGVEQMRGGKTPTQAAQAA